MFVKRKGSTTLFIKRNNKDLLLVEIYVDNIIFSSTNENLCKKFAKIMQGEFKISMIGELTFSFGVQITQTEEGTFIH